MFYLIPSVYICICYKCKYIHYAHSVFKNSKWEINASVTLISTPTQFSAKTDKIKLSLKLVKKGKKNRILFTSSILLIWGKIFAALFFSKAPDIKYNKH